MAYDSVKEGHTAFAEAAAPRLNSFLAHDLRLFNNNNYNLNYIYSLRQATED
jgi:hypothetical protein